MKITTSKLLPFLFAIYSFNALSQSYIDHSYGFLEPQVIYNQAKYFPESRLQKLVATKGLPTQKEIANLKSMLAETKSVARMERFGQESIALFMPIAAYLGLVAATYGVTYSVTFAASLALGSCGLVFNPWGLHIWSGTAAAFMVSHLMERIFADPAAMDTVKHHLGIKDPRIGGKRPSDALTDLEVSYVAHKHLISPKLQEKAEEMLFLTRLGGTPISTTKSFVGTLISLQKSQTRTCAIKRSWEEIEKDISNGLSRYSEELQDEVLNLAYTYYINANSDNSSLARLVAFFLGAPGLGKSRAAAIVAKAFEVPVVTVSLAGYSPRDLWGSESTPGILISKLADFGCDSGVMVFEDIDSAITGGSQAQSLEASLLELFDTTQNSIGSSFLQAEARTSKIFMIGTGNTAFVKQALADRVKLVTFPDFTAEIKEEIMLEEYLESRLKDHKISASEFAPALEALKREIATDKNIGLRNNQRIVDMALAKFGRERAKNATKH